MASHNPTSFRPIYCTASSYGIPDFGAGHPFIEKVMEEAEARRLSQPGVPPRQVALVTKSTKEKGRLRHALYRSSKGATGHELRWALHWALRIDDIYFELHRIEHTDNITFTASTWSLDRTKQITDVDSDFSTTYMTNQEIVDIGLHYVRCWKLNYGALRNNCQKLLIAVSQDCLNVSSQDLSHAWIGYKAVHAGAAALQPITHTALALVGCPKEQHREFNDALINWGLTYLDVSISDKFGGYQNLRRDLRETSSPWATLFKDYRRRVVYNAHLNQAPFTLFPYVEGLGTDHPKITNMQDSSPKWKNRTLLPFLPLHAVLGSGFFLYDLAMVTVSEPSAIKGAFDRRAEQNGNPGLRNYVKSDLTGLISNLHLPENDSLDNLESKYELSKEAILRFWIGDSTWEEVVAVWKQRMKEEGVSWDDVAKQLTTKRRQIATTAAELLPESLTDKEKAIRRLLNFTILVVYVGTISLAGMAFNAVLESVEGRRNH